jgi:hypothetical protein
MSRQLAIDDTVTAAPDNHWREVDDEAVILSMPTGEMFELNATGTRVWQLIQQPVTVGELRDRLVESYDVDPETCLRDLLQLLQDLAARGLIEVRGVDAP